MSRRLPGPNIARPAITRTMRLTDRFELPTGEQVVKTLSGAGIIVRVRPAVDGQKPSQVRRTLDRTAKRLGVTLYPVEFNGGTYDQQGKAVESGLPTAYQAIGDAPALWELAHHYAISEWHYAMNARVPTGAAGAGPEKVRPPMGSAFGKPGQLSATAAQLARQHDATMKAAGIYPTDDE